MKNAKTTFLKGLKTLIVVGFLSLISLTPLSQAKADVLLASVGITASPSSISSGQSTTLNWTSTNATSISISPSIGSVSPYGSITVSPSQTTTYTITGTNTTGGYATAQATVTVNNSGQQTNLDCANGSTMTPSEFYTAYANGKISINVSISGSQANFSVMNNTTCTAPISMASYKIFRDWSAPDFLSSQVFNAGTGSINLQPGSSSYNVGIASCRTQADFYYGSAPTQLLDSNPYTAPNVPFVPSFGSMKAYAYSNTPICTNPVLTCQDPNASNYGGALPCTYPPQLCQDPTASNYHGALPCTYPPQLCQDPTATNYHGAIPCHYPAPTCQDPNATNYHVGLPCTYPPQLCQDPNALNYHGTLPCSYPGPTCQDPSATNYHGAIPCTYPAPTCQDPSANNYHGALPCTYPPQLCQDPSANNYHSAIPCTYTNNNNGNSSNPNTNTNTNTNNNTNNFNPVININGGGGNNVVQTCQDFNASNYGGALPCNYYTQTCQDINAINYHGTLPCRYNTYVQTCQDPAASNYGNTLPCNYYTQTCLDTTAFNYRGPLPCRYNTFTGNQPTVGIAADDATVNYNGTTTVRWFTTNATSCTATNGSIGWAGPKSIGPGSFFTGSLTNASTYTITCTNGFGSATDSVTVNVRGRNIINNNPVAATSLVLITSSVDRNQPIVPSIDNTRPHPGDQINYTVNYQNVGTGAVTGLTLRMNLPLEVDYVSSNPSNPVISGNTLIFNLGTLRANAQGTVTVRVVVRSDIPAGTNLNFPATLSYVDPSGQPQSVSANVSAQVWSGDLSNNNSFLGANVFGAGGFFPTNLFGWLLLIVLILLFILLIKYLLDKSRSSSTKKTTTTTINH